MSAGIKRMLAERANIEKLELAERVGFQPRKKLLESEAAMKMIDLAQPFIDEHATEPTKWPPSSLLRIGYCLIGTSENPETALDFVERHLSCARRRFKAGLDPNPFLGRAA